MNDLGIWSIQSDRPARLRRSRVSLEKHLEQWIENDPTLLQSGLIIVGRQMRCEGGFIDLLAVDTYTGEWVVVEIKRGNVRRQTILQAIDYAASIDMMSSVELRTGVEAYLSHQGVSLDNLIDDGTIDENIFEADRRIRLCVVGTGRDPQLERMTDYLVDKHNMRITVIDFDTFVDESDNRYLTRNLTDQDNVPSVQDSTSTVAEQSYDDGLQRLFQLADENGIGKQFRMIYDACSRLGMYPRLYKWSIMYTPPQHKGRCLVVAWVKPTSGLLKAYAIPEIFAEYYPISEEDAVKIIGTNERRLQSVSDTQRLIIKLDELFEAIRANDSED